MLLNIIFILVFFLLSIITYYILERHPEKEVLPSSLNQVCNDGLIPCSPGLSCENDQCKSDYLCQVNDDCITGMVCAGNKFCMNVLQDGELYSAPNPYSGCVPGTTLDSTGTLCLLIGGASCNLDSNCVSSYCNKSICDKPPSYGDTCRSLCDNNLYCSTTDNLSLCQDTYKTKYEGAYCYYDNQCNSGTCEKINGYGICSSNGLLNFSDLCNNNKDCSSNSCITNICDLKNIQLKGKTLYVLDGDLKEYVDVTVEIDSCITFTGYNNVFGIYDGKTLYIYSKNTWSSISYNKNTAGVSSTGNYYFNFDRFFVESYNIFGNIIYYEDNPTNIIKNGNDLIHSQISGNPLFITKVNLNEVIIGTLIGTNTVNMYQINILSKNINGSDNTSIQGPTTNYKYNSSDFKINGPSVDGIILNGNILIAILDPVDDSDDRYKQLYYYTKNKFFKSNQKFSLKAKLKFIDSKLFIYNI